MIGTRVGDEMLALAERLYPIGRSLTGDGVRETLRELEKYVPIELHEVPTGTPVYDWTIPREWNVRDAFDTSVTWVESLVSCQISQLSTVPNANLPASALARAPGTC